MPVYLPRRRGGKGCEGEGDGGQVAGVEAQIGLRVAVKFDTGEGEDWVRVRSEV